MTEKKQTAYIAFQGGGVLGMAHLGAWKAVSQEFDIRGVAGTSAGSVVAAFCAAGFQPDHTIDIFRELDWSKLVRRQNCLKILRKRNGFSDGKNFLKWLTDKLKEHLDIDKGVQDKFDYLYQKTNIYLAIVACDLNTKEPVVFNKEKRPNDSVSRAVRASISIPIFFEPLKNDNVNEVLVDGGLLLNYPIKLLYELAKKDNAVLIGVRFKEKPNYLDNLDVWKVAKASLETMQKPGNKLSEEMIQYPKYIEVEIDVEGFDFLNFNLTKDERNKLLKRGVEATERMLDKWKPEQQSHYHKERQQTQIANPDLSYYIERPPIESNCDKEILKPGALIRIKAPNEMGKTFLITKILEHVPQEEYRVVRLSIRRVEQDILNSLKKFLHWFCSEVSKQLSLENQLKNYWDAENASNNANCTAYFEEYLLPQINLPLILALDDVDLLFPYREVAGDFFSMLRHWYEIGKVYDTWKKLRLVLAHSTEVYVPLNINQSPFNVGMPVELDEFNQQQVLDLARRYKLDWQNDQVQNLMAVVGGHPALVFKAVEHISLQKVSLETLMQTASTESGIYSNHLRHYFNNLQAVPDLAEALKHVVTSLVPVELNPTQTYKLHSMGLVHRQNNCVMPRCKLYREYFTRVLK
ncbi:MAG: AAA-like domain-containing protein [Stigonema ocellatum SAG 48.90 = DSM 106950]|nr:AAA-like domain-containing protein [Stigonema ocellatum SAG 48.90 = DSM 106950]